RFPHESELYALKAGIGVLTGNEAEIDEATRQALAIDPLDADALRFRGVLEQNYRGDPEPAIRLSRQALRLAPADDGYASTLVDALDARDYKREAERVLRSGLDERPDSYTLRTNYATFLMQQDRLAESRAQHEIA